MRRGRHPGGTEPRRALSGGSRGSAPLRPRHGDRPSAAVSRTHGHPGLPCAHVRQPTEPPDAGAKRHLRLAQETALAQVLSCLQTADDGEGRTGGGEKLFKLSSCSLVWRKRLQTSARGFAEVIGRCCEGLCSLEAII